jgi:uncharacterized membrane protein HdeD (DUF308 family)
MGNSYGADTVAEGRVPWWIVLLEGIFSVALGVVLFLYPFATFTAFLVVLGCFWIISGIFGLIALVAGIPVGSKWWASLIWGLLSIIAGILVLNHPFMMTLVAQAVLVYVVAFMLIISGVSAIVTANRWSQYRESKWGIIIFALLFIILGIILLFSPFLSFYIVTILVGAFSFVFGIAMIIYSFMMRAGHTSA